MNKIRVLIVSQQSLFRQGIEHSLSDVEDIKVLGTAEVNDEVLSAIDTLPPDVALVDVDAPADSGLTLAASHDVEPGRFLDFVVHIKQFGIQRIERLYIVGFFGTTESVPITLKYVFVVIGDQHPDTVVVRLRIHL